MKPHESTIRVTSNGICVTKQTTHRHQDNSESRATIAAGVPVVSISIGADAVFSFAKERPAETPDARRPPSVVLKSGDVLLFGGPARTVFHGVERIVDPRRTTRPQLGFRQPGRLNLTFRMS